MHRSASLVVKKGLIVLRGVKSCNIVSGFLRSNQVVKAWSVERDGLEEKSTELKTKGGCWDGCHVMSVPSAECISTIAAPLFPRCFSEAGGNQTSVIPPRDGRLVTQYFCVQTRCYTPHQETGFILSPLSPARSTTNRCYKMLEFGRMSLT